MPAKTRITWARGPTRLEFAPQGLGIRLPHQQDIQTLGLAKAIRTSVLEILQRQPSHSGDYWVSGSPSWLSREFPSALPVFHHVFPSVETFWNLASTVLNKDHGGLFVVGAAEQATCRDLLTLATSADTTLGNDIAPFLSNLHRQGRAKSWAEPWMNATPSPLLERRAGELFPAPIWSSAWEGRKRWGLLGKMLGMHGVNLIPNPGQHVRSSLGFGAVLRAGDTSPSSYAFACARGELPLKPRDLGVGQAIAQWADGWAREVTGFGLDDQKQIVVACPYVGMSLLLDRALQESRVGKTPLEPQHWDLLWGWNPALSSAMFLSQGESRRILFVVDQFARPFIAAVWQPS
jgi:hypothetical protein